MMKKSRKQSGFTLVEIAFALLVLGLGLLSIVKCFPSGLRQSMEAHNEAVTALFADGLFSALHAAACNVDGYTGATELTLEDLPEEIEIDELVEEVPEEGEWSGRFDYPVGSGQNKLDKIQYKYDISSKGNRLYEIKLDVKAGESGGRTKTFVTELFFVSAEYEE